MEDGGIAIITPADGPAAAARPFPRLTTQSKGESWEVRFISDTRRVNQAEPLILSLPKDAKLLPGAMARELQAAYEVLGWQGVGNLAAGVFGLEAYSRFIEADGLGQKSFFGSAKGVAAIELMTPAVAPDRRPLWEAFVLARRALVDRVADCEAQITKAAHEVATLRIAQCRALLIEEAARYLSLSAPKDAAARSLFTSGAAGATNQAQVPLAGPEGPALRAAVQHLWPLTGQLRAAQGELLKRSAGGALSRVAKGAADRLEAAKDYGPRQITVFLPLLRASAEVGDMLQGEGRDPAASALAAAAAAHSNEFVRLAGGYPILFRLVDESGVDAAELTQAIVTALQSAWAAADAVTAELAEDQTPTGSAVWLLPILIDLTVRQRFLNDAAFAERVAADLLRKRGADIRPIAALNTFISWVDVSLIGVPLPPVQLAGAILGLIGNLAEMAESWVEDSAQRNGSRMALDPDLALSAEPSAVTYALMAFVTALGVLPVPGLAKQVLRGAT